MAKKEEKDDDDRDEKVDEIVVVTDKPEDLDTPPINGGEFGGNDDEGTEELKAKAKERDKAKGKKESKDEEADEDDDSDTRLGASEDDEDEEDKKKRQTHKTRRQRRKEAEFRLRNELKFLESRNDQLERGNQQLARRLDAVETGTLDDRINRHKSLIAKAESVIADGTTNNKGVEVVEATRIRDKLKDELDDFEDAKKARTGKGEEDREERRPPDPRIVARANKWYRGNDWFDFKRGDYDSKIAGAIDDSLVAEGYDPADDDYWEELSTRIAKALPHRVGKKSKRNGKKEAEVDDEDEDESLGEDEDQEEEVERKPKKKSSGGPKFRSGGSGRELRPNEVHLSRERIAALKELGVWDDPKLRNKYLKRYRDYDRDNGVDQ